MFESQLIVKLLQAIRGWVALAISIMRAITSIKAKKLRRAFDVNRRRCRQRCEP